MEFGRRRMTGPFERHIGPESLGWQCEWVRGLRARVLSPQQKGTGLPPPKQFMRVWYCRRPNDRLALNIKAKSVGERGHRDSVGPTAAPKQAGLRAPEALRRTCNRECRPPDLTPTLLRANRR